MIQHPPLRLAALAVLLACASPSAGYASDPLTRFLDGLLKNGNAAQEPVQAAPAPAAEAAVPAPPAPRAAAPAPRPQAVERAALRQAAAPRRASTPPAAPTPAPEPRPAVEAAAPQPVQTAQAVTPVAQKVPTSPEAALDRINDYFNGIDQLTASFVQNSSNGPRTDGSLYLKRPGQLRFAYSPPSTLEIVSDGRSVAIRDKKLGTNDVYSVGQTPLKFLLKDQFNLARDVKVQDVQVSPAGVITVRFEDSATIGGTSKVTLRFDARANELKQWTVIDPQGYETTVVLSNVDVVPRGGAVN